MGALLPVAEPSLFFAPPRFWEKLRAGALNHGLAPRESLIVVSESLASVVYAGPSQIAGAWWTYGKRLIATLDDAVHRYPNDPELWYMLGDARFHAGFLARVPQRAITLP